LQNYSVCVALSSYFWPDRAQLNVMNVADVEIEALCRFSGPPEAPIPYGGISTDWESPDASFQFPHNAYGNEFSGDLYPTTISSGEYETTPEKYQPHHGESVLGKCTSFNCSVQISKHKHPIHK